MRVTHSKISGKLDKADTSLVRPSDWNAEHVLDTGNTVFVAGVADLPEAVSGVITLESGTTYHLLGDIDLAGARIEFAANCALVGGASETCTLSSAGLTGALITSRYSVPMRDLTITADLALDLDGIDSPGASIDWFGVNFVNCATVGTLKNYGSVLINTCAFLNSQGLTFDGGIATASFSQCIYTVRAGGTGIIGAGTLAVSRRFRVIYSAFDVPGGCNGIAMSNSATLPGEGYILDTVNFSGAGTMLTGPDNASVYSLHTNCRGIPNSATIAYLTMVGNATATTIAAQSTPVKIAGDTVTQAVTQNFTCTDNRAEYSGALSRTVRATATITCTAGNTHQVAFYFAKNGVVAAETQSIVTTGGSGRAEGARLQGVFSAAPGDTFEVWCANNTAISNVTAVDMSVIIEAID